MAIYKPLYQQYDQTSMDDFYHSLKDDLRSPFVINLNTNEPTSDYNFEQLLFFVNDYISQIYVPDAGYIENMFDFQLNPQVSIDMILNYLIQILTEEKLSSEDIKQFYYPEFVCYVLYTQNMNNFVDIPIVMKAILIFNYLAFDDHGVVEIMEWSKYAINFLNLDNLDIIASLLPIVGYLFDDEEFARDSVNNETLINQVLQIAKTEKNTDQCSHALRLFRLMVYFTIKVDNENQFFQPQYFEKLILIVFPYITLEMANIPLSILDESLKLFQIISSNVDMLTIAMKIGLEKKLIQALTVLPISRMCSLYKIFRNILYFANNGDIRTKLINFVDFFTITAKLIKSNVDEKTFDVIITTIDLLGIGFWRDLLDLDVCNSLLEKMEDTTFQNKKRICSLLLNFFKESDTEFKRTYCNEQIIQSFVDMLEYDDSQFCIEIITNLSFYLSSDPEYFQPLLEQFEYDQLLEELTESNDKELAELAQSNLENSFNY